MSGVLAASGFVGAGGQAIALSSMFSVSNITNNQAYLVLTCLDRNEYNAGATGATGTLSGNGATGGFISIGGDGRGFGIVFTYQASTGSYYNSTYGDFNNVTYTSSTSDNDVASLSIFSSSAFGIANAYKYNAYSLMTDDPLGYLGSVTVATQASFTGPVPKAATPNSIAAVAQSFVGKAWNMDGCWTLASTIAAQAGASLPIDSTMIGTPGQSNGEWILAYDGTQQSGNWQSLVKTGEIIVIGDTSSGHITTCVSGSGNSAKLIDNITYVNAQNQVTNLANDGSTKDVVIAAPHTAPQEWTGVSSRLVKIYELDTPVVAAAATTLQVGLNSNQSFSNLVSASDPAGKIITQYQIYDTASSDSILINGASVSAQSAATAVTTSTLSSASLATGSIACTDTVYVRAFNGSYWGDWQSIAVTVSGSSPTTTLGQDFLSELLSTARLYQAALGRQPDQSGLNYYANNLKSGGSLSDFANEFLNSPEFTAKYGNINTISLTTYITELYGNVLGRTPVQSEINYYMSDLAAGDTVSGLLQHFAASSENVARTSYLDTLHQNTSGIWWF